MNEKKLEGGPPDINKQNTETLEQTLAEKKEKAERYLTNWQRAEADHINYKRHIQQEKEEAALFTNAALILKLLPVLDDLERAFASIPPELAELDWVGGVKLIERKLRTSLELQGLAPISALGEPFDPHSHEAVRQDKGKLGMVIGEVQKGYKLHNRVIRPSKVAVGNGETEAKEAQSK